MAEGYSTIYRRLNPTNESHFAWRLGNRHMSDLLPDKLIEWKDFMKEGTYPIGLVIGR